MRYEAGIKNSESKLGSCLGSNGRVLAVRKGLFPHIPDVSDDFYVPMKILISTGAQVRFEPRAKALIPAAATLALELERKIRTHIALLRHLHFLKRVEPVAEPDLVALFVAPRSATICPLCATHSLDLFCPPVEICGHLRVNHNLSVLLLRRCDYGLPFCPSGLTPPDCLLTLLFCVRELGCVPCMGPVGTRKAPICVAENGADHTYGRPSGPIHAMGKMSISTFQEEKVAAQLPTFGWEKERHSRREEFFDLLSRGGVKRLLFLACDATALTLSYWLSLICTQKLFAIPRENLSPHGYFIFYLPFVLVVLSLGGGYQSPELRRPEKELAITFRGVSLTFLGLVCANFIFFKELGFSRYLFVSWYFLAIVAIPSLRLVVRGAYGALWRRGLAQQRAVWIGCPEKLAEFEKLLSVQRFRGYRMVGVVPASDLEGCDPLGECARPDQPLSQHGTKRSTSYASNWPWSAYRAPARGRTHSWVKFFNTERPGESTSRYSPTCCYLRIPFRDGRVLRVYPVLCGTGLVPAASEASKARCGRIRRFGGQLAHGARCPNSWRVDKAGGRRTDFLPKRLCWSGRQGPVLPQIPHYASRRGSVSGTKSRASQAVRIEAKAQT